MTITFGSVVLFFAIICLIIATTGFIPDKPRWRWFQGGMLLWAISLFVSVSIK